MFLYFATKTTNALWKFYRTKTYSCTKIKTQAKTGKKPMMTPAIENKVIYCKMMPAKLLGWSLACPLILAVELRVSERELECGFGQWSSGPRLQDC